MFVNEISLTASSTPVKSVTIFQSSTAEVTRALTLELKNGKNVVEIAGISSNATADSFRIAGAPAGMHVRDLVCRRRARDAPAAPSPELDALDEKLKSLRAARQVRSEETLLLESAARLVTTGGSARSGDGAPADGDALLAFVAKYAERTLAVRAALQEVDVQIRAAERQLWALRNARKGEVATSVTATIVAESDGKADLKLTYLVGGVRWTPFYDLHATTADGQPSADVSVRYCAAVSQRTGEDWADTALTLSTATAEGQRQLSVPALAPLKIKLGTTRSTPPPDAPQRPTPYIQRFTPVQPPSIPPPQVCFASAPEPPYPVPVSFASFDRHEGWNDGPVVRRAEKSSESRSVGDVDAATPWPRTPEPEAAVDVAPKHSALSVAYRVVGAVSLPSDGEEHGLTIAVLPFTAALRYECVPRESEAAFIVATVENTSAYPLLAGPVSVFVDDSFVSKTALKFIAVNESFKCVLGVDPSLKVTFEQRSATAHEPRRSFAEPHTVTTRTVATTVTNQHARPVTELIVRDAVPLGNEDGQVAVTLRKPAGLAEAADGDSVAVTLGEDQEGVEAKVRWAKGADGKGGEKEGLYEWVCAIPAGKKISLEAQWDVKTPSNVEWHEGK